MGTLLRRISCVLVLLCVLRVQADDPPPFPYISDMEIEFYETQVTVTNLDQQITSLATEMYDSTVQRGKVDVLADGTRLTVFYNNDTNQILEVNSTTCMAWDIDESQFDYQPIFYGWLNKNPLIIGPTAPLWHAQEHRDEIKSVGEAVVRGINCDAYSYRILNRKNDFTMKFYFASKNWVTAYSGMKLRVPIRIEIRGTTSEDLKDPDLRMPLNQITDFGYFKPSISDWLAFQPPIGIGCPLRKTTRTIPTFPKVFQFSAESYDLFKAESDQTDVVFQQMWYDSTRLIARLDKYTKLKYTKELYDFNMGVTYSLLNGRTCSIKPLKDSFFEAYDGKLMGHMKEPAEVLDMDGDFYYMGDRLIRGIWTESYESVKFDAEYGGKMMAKLVVTVYYTKENLEVAVSGETEARIPVFYIVTGWDTLRHKAVQIQYNIFAFDDVVWPEMYASFQLDRCFPSMNDKSYFIMIMNENIDMARRMEGMDDLFKQEVKNKISELTKVSDMRIPFLAVDYKATGVFITGLILERPPAILQFIEELEAEAITTDPDIKLIPESDSKETCAYACVDEENFICTGFYFCNQACFLKSKDMLDRDNDGDKKDLGKCKTFLRAERDSSNKGTFLVDALQRLEKAVVDGKFKVPIRLSEKETIDVPVNDIVIGDGPYTGDDNQEKPYNEVMKLAKLKVDRRSTTAVSDVSTLNDCFKACQNADTTSCASFSYCPTADNKQCLISSVLVVNRELNVRDTDDDANCFIYSIKYLEFYKPYPGRVFLITGDESFDRITSAELCAKKCREASKFTCRGFEYCRNTKTCVLHSKHVMDLKHENNTHNPLIKPSVCTHYAAKFAADYYDMGAKLVDDNSNVRNEITLEECAKVCSEELKNNCRSFNYCPATDEYSTDSSCALSTLVTVSPGVKYATKDKCKHYEKKAFVDDWTKPKIDQEKKIIKEETVKDDSGYTSKGFTGLVIGMLALGLVIGSIGFVLYSYFRSRSSGEGLTVRFMKSDI